MKVSNKTLGRIKNQGAALGKGRVLVSVDIY